MKIVIVHGSNVNDRENMIKYKLSPQNERDWIGWINEELKGRDIECVAPLMPENWAPVYEKWKIEFEKIEFCDDDILVGWSSGGAFLTRWLGENELKFKKLILVAPYIEGSKCEEGTSRNFHYFKIDEHVKERVD
ncbi:MAG: hypothetical protein PF542_06790 [Nanoarchaeota archaeon]|jgi:predicted alpha/beta hydrolase family esterase|nr:hypothetical protein [Nanoarchaeota archaeon]